MILDVKFEIMNRNNQEIKIFGLEDIDTKSIGFNNAQSYESFNTWENNLNEKLGTENWSILSLYFNGKKIEEARNLSFLLTELIDLQKSLDYLGYIPYNLELTGTKFKLTVDADVADFDKYANEYMKNLTKKTLR